MLTVGFGVLAWVVVVSRIAAAPGISTLERLVSMSYPLLGVLLLAVVARLLFVGARGARWAMVLLWIASQGLADIVYALTIIDGTFTFGGPLFAVWLLGYAALSVALLVPARSHAAARSAGAARAGRVVMAAAVTPLTVLLVVRAVQGSSDDVLLVAAGSVLMTVLALGRGALVAATSTTAAVRTAVKRAVARSTAGFLVLALLPITGLAYLAVSESQRAMEAEVRDRISLTASVSADYIREQLAGIEALVASYGNRLRLVEALQDPADLRSQRELDRQMASLRVENPDMLSAWVLSPDGLMLSVQPPSPERMDGDYGREDYVAGALGAREPYVSTSYAPDVPGDHRAVDVAVAVRDGQGEVVGVVVVSYLLDGIRTFSARLSRSRACTSSWPTRRARRSAAPSAATTRTTSSRRWTRRSTGGRGRCASARATTPSSRPSGRSTTWAGPSSPRSARPTRWGRAPGWQPAWWPPRCSSRSCC
jgi:hypothetical protein